MPVPTQDTNHVSEAIALLTSRYAGLVIVPGMVKALTGRLQELENDCFAMLNAIQLANHPMAGGPWDILDKLGSIVGAARNGLDDADYLALIKLTAKANRSRGNPEDILTLAAIMSAVTPLYLEFEPAAFYLGVYNLPLNYPIFQSLLSRVRPAGVYGLMVYTMWATGNDLILGSRYGGAKTQGGLGSRYAANVGGVMAASVAL